MKIATMAIMAALITAPAALASPATGPSQTVGRTDLNECQMNLIVNCMRQVGSYTDCAMIYQATFC